MIEIEFSALACLCLKHCIGTKDRFVTEVLVLVAEAMTSPSHFLGSSLVTRLVLSSIRTTSRSFDNLKYLVDFSPYSGANLKGNNSICRGP